MRAMSIEFCFIVSFELVQRRVVAHLYWTFLLTLSGPFPREAESDSGFPFIRRCELDARGGLRPAFPCNSGHFLPSWCFLIGGKHHATSNRLHPRQQRRTSRQRARPRGPASAYPGLLRHEG